jgi:hypothetical protein
MIYQQRIIDSIGIFDYMACIASAYLLLVAVADGVFAHFVDVLFHGSA